MLVLTRKVGQSLMIGDEIQVTVMEVNRGQVRVGIRAPRSIAIHRKEVFDKILEHNQNADDATPSPTVTDTADIFGEADDYSMGFPYR